MIMAKPVLNYFSICGRGELARLVAAAGELSIEDKAWSPAFDDTGSWRQGYADIGNKHGFPGTMPVLEHDEFNLFEAQAIESYFASIAPKYQDLTPQQRAKDLMFALIKADINIPTENVLFKKITPEDLAPIMIKWYGYIEGLCPESGYVNGLEFPTMADLAVVVICKGCMPFQAASQMSGVAFDPVKFPKMERIATLAMDYGPVAAFLEKSEHKTLKADPFKIMPEEYHA